MRNVKFLIVLIIALNAMKGLTVYNYFKIIIMVNASARKVIMIIFIKILFVKKKNAQIFGIVIKFLIF